MNRPWLAATVIAPVAILAIAACANPANQAAASRANPAASQPAAPPTKPSTRATTTPKSSGLRACTASDFVTPPDAVVDDAMGGYHSYDVTLTMRGTKSCRLSTYPTVQHSGVTFPRSSFPYPGPRGSIVGPGQHATFMIFLRTAGAGAPPDPSCHPVTYQDLTLILGNGDRITIPGGREFPCQGAGVTNWSVS